jgi:transposase
MCQSEVVEQHFKERRPWNMVSTIGMDIAKQVFQAHGADEAGAVVFRKKIARAKVLTFFASQPACLVVMEACGGAHSWGREIASLATR